MTKFIYICDRCGRDIAEGEELTIRIDTSGRCKKRGEICEECFQDFCDIIESFFDDLNKEATDDRD